MFFCVNNFFYIIRSVRIELLILFPGNVRRKKKWKPRSFEIKNRKTFTFCLKIITVFIWVSSENKKRAVISTAFFFLNIFIYFFHSSWFVFYHSGWVWLEFEVSECCEACFSSQKSSGFAAIMCLLLIFLLDEWWTGAVQHVWDVWRIVHVVRGTIFWWMVPNFPAIS